MEIRKIRQEDFDQILSMMEVFYASDALLIHPDTQTLAKTLTDCIADGPYLEGFIMEDEDRLVGYAQALRRRQLRRRQAQIILDVRRLRLGGVLYHQLDLCRILGRLKISRIKICRTCRQNSCQNDDPHPMPQKLHHVYQIHRVFILNLTRLAFHI